MVSSRPGMGDQQKKKILLFCRRIQRERDSFTAYDIISRMLDAGCKHQPSRLQIQRFLSRSGFFVCVGKTNHNGIKIYRLNGLPTPHDDGSSDAPEASKDGSNTGGFPR